MTVQHVDLSAGRRRCTPRRADSVRGNAVRYLARAGDRWIRTSELCKAFSLRACDLIPALRHAERNGDIQSKDAGHRALMWRFIPLKRPDGKTFSIDWPPMFVSRWDEACKEVR